MCPIFTATLKARLLVFLPPTYLWRVATTAQRRHHFVSNGHFVGAYGGLASRFWNGSPAAYVQNGTLLRLLGKLTELSMTNLIQPYHAYSLSSPAQAWTRFALGIGLHKLHH
jgi:hypothetical protein